MTQPTPGPSPTGLTGFDADGTLVGEALCTGKCWTVEVPQCGFVAFSQKMARELLRQHGAVDIREEKGTA